MPAQPVATEESLPHLACTVCLSFPEKDILQCNSGHIMCRQCYDRVCAEERPQCPTCRDVLDISKVVRNTLAEQTIALLPVACPNAPCHGLCHHDGQGQLGAYRSLTTTTNASTT